MVLQIRKLDVCGRPLFANSVTYVTYAWLISTDLVITEAAVICLANCRVKTGLQKKFDE